MSNEQRLIEVMTELLAEVHEVHINGKMPKAVTVEDKTTNEKVQLIYQLEEEDKHAVFRIIDGMLTKSKFQTFFEQNIQTIK